MTSASTQPRAVQPPAELDWKEFSARYFSERRRHDLEALQAYGVYRKGLPSAGAAQRVLAEDVWEGEGGR
jgi:hypothetical protein